MFNTNTHTHTCTGVWACGYNEICAKVNSEWFGKEKYYKLVPKKIRFDVIAAINKKIFIFLLKKKSEYI